MYNTYVTIDGYHITVASYKTIECGECAGALLYRNTKCILIGSFSDAKSYIE